ncbi:MAG: SpoVA/SpoVAEb family sporulation membrane protein [Bacilli bacterium]|nr:SpoVA/SpoVAEb family sporulation membrane protein [Bacilli bacterium]MDD4406894.1 SpoVA/SpoVAEb family sporulation membrane protein [Bacilli bacterium]
MNKKEYLKLVKEITPKENRLSNSLNAFLVGGILGVIAEIIKMILVNLFSITVTEAIGWVLLIYIFLAALFTALGFMDDLAQKYKSGLLIPITGFAHSITSAIMDYKKDGLITGVGSNVFKLAGCVLLYGIFFAFVMAILKAILYA